ncbi:Ig-like domain repeat protein [Methanobrevibacter sp.]|uniref:Ig-like domain-containing protein n=1 Tax=Methanobrevibacter sp. TaxID=66852 RepID=UPI00388F2DB0
MRSKIFLCISIVLLAAITLGVASAADNSTNDLNLEFEEIDEIEMGEPIKNSPEDSSPLSDEEKITPNLTVKPTAESYKYGADATITVRLSERDAGIDGEVQATIDNTTYPIAITNGDGRLTIPNLETGSYPVTVKFNGTDRYESVTNTDATIVIEKSRKVTANVVVENTTYGNPAILKITNLSDVDGNPVSAYGGFQLVGPAHPYGSIYVRKGSLTTQFNDLPVGNYTAWIVFGNNIGGTYEFENYAVDFVVNKAPMILTSEILDEAYNTKTLKINVADLKNKKISGKINITIDGETFLLDENITGEMNIALNSLKKGTHSIDISFDDANYEKASQTKEITIEREITSVNLTAEYSAAGENAVININVFNATGKVSVILNGREEILTLDKNGNAKYVIRNIAPGDYFVTAIYHGNDNYGFASAQTSFSIDKLNSSITVNATDSKIGENVTVSVNVSEGATGIVMIDINGNKYAINLTDSNSTTVEFERAGTYDITATYLGDDSYKQSSGSATVVVSDKLPANIKVILPERIESGDEINVNVSADSDAELTVYINDELFTGKNMTLTSGIYNITVVAPENENYKSETYFKVFEVTKKEPSISITSIDNVKIGDVISVNVESESDGEITVEINGVNVTGDYEIKTSGVYTVTAESSETDNYKKGFETYTFTVEEEAVEPKKNPTIVIEIPDDIKASASVLVNVSVLNATGNVTIILDGLETTKTLENGIANINMENITEGNHTITAIYYGDETYNPAHNTANLEIAEKITPQPEKQNTTITITTPEEIKTGDTININVNIANATGNVTIIFDGDENSLTLENGSGKLLVENITAGKHTITAIYYGDETYNPAHNTVNIEIAEEIIPQPEKQNTTITITTPEEIKTGDTINIYINIKNATGNISVFIDGDEKLLTLENGSADIQLNSIPVGLHSISAVYYGDENYLKSTASKSFRVDKQKTEISVKIGEIKINEPVIVEINIPNATGNIQVIADGEKHVVPLDENGTATVDIGKASAGSHGIVVIYEGDESRTPAYSIANFTVANYIVTEFANITIMEDMNITAALLDADGNPISNATVNYSIGSMSNSTKTGVDGSFTIAGMNGELIAISYAGNDTYLAASTSIRLNNASPEMLATQFNVTNGYRLEVYAVDYKAGERGAMFDVLLTDSNGNPLANQSVLFGINGWVHNKTTDANGVAHLQINLQDANYYTCAPCYLGNTTYNATFASAMINVVKKPITISASAKSYKATAKTKKYTVTLKTIKGSSADGKTYLSAGKKVTLKINGKTYTSKINAKGQATFSIKLTKKGKFQSVVNFAGDNTYESASKKVTITIK